jgi:hypothetical protein
MLVQRIDGVSICLLLSAFKPLYTLAIDGLLVPDSLLTSQQTMILENRIN